MNAIYPQHALSRAKVTPPRHTGGLLQREPLLSRMLKARRLRCMVVRAPAGTGKTSLMTAFQQALTPLGFEVAWLSLSADVDCSAGLLHHLLASFDQIHPTITDQARPWLQGGIAKEAIERTTIGLIQGLSRYEREVTLMIDDLHLVKDPFLLEYGIQFLIEHAPPNLHFVMSARGLLPLSFEHLHADGQLLELGVDDLAFTRQETESFLRHRLGSAEPRDAHRLHNAAEGWPAGIQMLAFQQSSPEQRRHRHRLAHQDSTLVAHYFEREVMSLLHPADIERLVQLSICSSFCVPLASAVLGELTSPRNSARLIAHLVHQDLFIYPVDGQNLERWFRLHPLLRELLLSRYQALPPAERQRLNARAADWFESAGLMDEAVRHRIDADQVEHAVALVERYAQEMHVRGDFQTIAAVLRRLPPQALSRSLQLRLLHGQLQWRAGHLDAYAEILDDLERDTPPIDDFGRFQLAQARAAYHIQRDDTEAARLQLEPLKPLTYTADARFEGRLRNQLSLVYLHAGRFEEARNLLEQNADLLTDRVPLEKDPAGLLFGRCFTGLSHVQEGNIKLAERQYRAVLRVTSSNLHEDTSEPACMAAALLGEVLHERNEPHAALALLLPRLDLLQRIAIPDTALRALLSAARCQFLLGREAEGSALLEQLEEYATRHRLDRLIASSLLEKLMLQLRKLDLRAADTVFRRMERLECLHAKSSGAQAEIRVIVATARAHRTFAGGELASAAAQVCTLSEQCEALGHWRRVAHFRMLGAAIHDRLQEKELAAKLAWNVLDLGHGLGLVRTLLDAAPEAPRLIHALRQRPQPDPLLTFYMDRLLAADASLDESPTGPGDRNRIEPLSQRELDVLRMLMLALPNKRIARTMGLSLETIKWHLRNIYRKLGVSGRDEAVTRARDLLLII